MLSLLTCTTSKLPASHEQIYSTFRRRYSELPWLAICCTYIRDREAGKIVLGADGLPRVHYWPSPHDQASILNVRPPAFTFTVNDGNEDFSSHIWSKSSVFPCCWSWRQPAI